MLANERTLAAWWRTAMAALAAAVGFAHLFGDNPAWLVKGGASALVLLALLVLLVDFRRYRATARRVEASETVDRIAAWALRAGSLLLTAAALAAGLSIWLP